MGELVLGCPAGHRFDANRRGYLSVAESSRGVLGDPVAVLEQRERFLARGHYRAIADAVVGLAKPDVPPQGPLDVLDSGCGTGYYLEALLSNRPGAWHGMAMDVSAAAVQRAVRATGAAGLVADVWRPLPVRSARADLLLCVFAPRNAAEFQRVLRAGGALIVVTPAPEHLEQLRAAGLAIGMQENKSDRLDEKLAAHFTLDRRESLSYAIDLDEEGAAELAGMGPSGHHELSGTWNGGEVTVSVEVSRYRPLLSTEAP